jgi:hypothetical protein
MVQYKPLCEVKLMHEYFLTRSNGSSPFARSTQAERLSFLEQAFKDDSESLDRDLRFEFPAFASYENQLKLISSYSGFRILVKTKSSTLADNTVVYKPALPLNPALDILVLIYKNDNFDSYTNTKFEIPFPAVYFISSNNPVGVSSFPYLSSNILPYDSRYKYEQGELVSFGANDTRSYYRGENSDEWLPAPGNYFVNESDRLLAPLRFYYSFFGESGIRRADFVLKNKAGDVIKTISVESTGDMSNAWLDFSAESGTLSIGGSNSLEDMFFTLEVTAGNGFTKTHRLLFNDSFERKGLWGVVHIRPYSSDSDYNLFAADGFLVHRIAPDGTRELPRIFEIPIKSRAAFWRFRNNVNRPIGNNPALNDYLKADTEGRLVSKRPKSITQQDFKMTRDGTIDPIYLPNPLSYDLNSDAEGRLYFEIVVPDSELFPAPPP